MSPTQSPPFSSAASSVARSQRPGPSRTPGKFLNISAILYYHAGFSIVTDIATILLPIPAVQKLQMNRRSKISLYFIFVIGGIGCIVSILRLPAINIADRTADFTFVYARIITWSTIEGNVGILCANLATLKPLVVRLRPRAFLSSTGLSGESMTVRHSYTCSLEFSFQ